MEYIVPFFYAALFASKVFQERRYLKRYDREEEIKRTAKLNNFSHQS